MATKKNKLLLYFGGKEVVLSFKGNPEVAITGILLDADEQYYYLGESTEVTSAVRCVEVNMMLDSASVQVSEFDESGERRH